MEGGLVHRRRAALASDITRSGHAAVYGIYFDTAKAEVKPESDAALKEIAKLLQQTPALKLLSSATPTALARWPRTWISPSAAPTPSSRP